MRQMYAHIDTLLGKMLACSDGQVITGLYFIGQKHELKLDASWQHDPSVAIFAQLQQQLGEYMQGTRKQFDVPYRFQGGTPFQQKVWKAITEVSCGKTISYSELTQACGAAPKAVRAVAAATGRNMLTLIVPCHRIVGSNGSLTGYAGGLQRKKALLGTEGKNSNNALSAGIVKCEGF